MNIPRTNPTDDQRKIKVLNDEIERLNSMITSGVPMPCAGSNDREVPVAVLFAAGFIYRFQDASTPRAIGGSSWSGECGEVVERESTTDELMAVGAACDLLRDFFDRNNHKLVADKAKSAKQCKQRK